MFCLSNFKQLSLIDQVHELNNLSFQEPIKFLELLKLHFDISTFIPDSFYDHYYKNLGKNRDFQLPSVLSALLFMHFFNIPTTSILCLFLALSSDLRDFCNLSKIPDEPFFSRFKSSFEIDITNLFNSLIPHILDICTDIDNSLSDDDPNKGLSSMLIYDTSGLKPKVKENNPKFLVSEIKKHKAFAKTFEQPNPKFNPYASAYKNMPKFASANSSIRLDFVNGHFGYFYKFGLLTNGFGIPLAIHFFDDIFYSNFNCDSFSSPEEQKYSFDNASLMPVLTRFISCYTDTFTSFLADSEFDSYDNFGFLHSIGFDKVFIPINPRNGSLSSTHFSVDDRGTPLCPRSSNPFIADGSCKGKNRSLRFKFVCPKSTRVGSNWTCHCEDPCKQTESTVTTYQYSHKDFRLIPGVHRSSVEYVNTYKKRTVIERQIASLKKNTCISTPNTLNTSTMRSDLFLNAISKLVTVILAYSINKPQYIRSLKKLVHAA